MKNIFKEYFVPVMIGAALIVGGCLRKQEKEIIKEEINLESKVEDPLAVYCKQAEDKYMSGKVWEAEKDLRKAIDWEPSRALAYYHLGRVRSLLGDKEGAVKYLETATRLDPNNEDYQKELLSLGGRVKKNREL